MKTAAIGLTCAALLLPAPARTRPPADGAEAFEAALANVARLAEAERWKSARELLLEALDDHAREPYVLERAGEVRATIADCDFWVAHDRPEPKEVVGGKLLSYKPTKGDIKLVYEPDEDDEELHHPPDFEGLDGALVHPAVFLDRSSIEVEGARIGVTQPELRAGIGEGGHYLAVFDMTSSSRLKRVRGGEEEVLDDTTDFVNVQRKYRVGIAIDGKSVTAFLNGKKYLKAKSPGVPSPISGRFSYAKCIAVKRITLKGRIDTAWIEGLIQKRTDELRAAFDATYDPRASLPDWLWGASR